MNGMTNLQGVTVAKFEQTIDEIYKQIDILEQRLDSVSLPGSPELDGVREMETVLSARLHRVQERLQRIINNLSL